MTPKFTPTEEEAQSFTGTRGTLRRRIEPQPWRHGDGTLAWKRPDSPREFDCIWVVGQADDMLDAKCPFAKAGRVFHSTERGVRLKAESVRAENGPNGWEWVIYWRVA